MNTGVILILLAGTLLPISAGFAMPFRSDDTKRRWLWIMALIPLPLLLFVAVMRARSIPDLSMTMIMVAIAALPLLFTVLGRAFGKPFAEIWREHQNDKLRETFE